MQKTLDTQRNLIKSTNIVGESNAQEKIKQFRINRLNQWIENHPEMKLGYRPYISQLRNGKATFGDRAARNLEQQYGMPDGYLDGADVVESDYITIGYFNINVFLNRNNISVSDISLITKNAMVRRIDLSRSQFGRLFGGYETENAIMFFSLQSDMMTPSISSSDIIFIDSSINRLAGSGIYVFILHNQLYVQRLQVTPEGINSMTDNPNYGNFSIPASEEKNLIIVAKCVGIMPFNIQNF